MDVAANAVKWVTLYVAVIVLAIAMECWALRRPAAPART
jgi:hypothetical protein